MFHAFRSLAVLCTVLSCLVGHSIAANKAVFSHYMVGSMTAAEAVTDVNDALAIGLDAFALNVASTDSWSTSAIADLFTAASGTTFKLFFSFDMNHFNDPSQFMSLITQYAPNANYYTVNGDAFLSTFNGGTLSFGEATPSDGWNIHLKQAAASAGIKLYFVPDFDDASGYPTGFFDKFPVVDGAFSWEATWPTVGEGQVNVSDSTDVAAIAGAHAASKTYMMPLSSVQFKHIDGGQNWYRLGELNLAQRMGQVLSVAPDFVEIVTWNDAGESHYIGNVWAEQIAGSVIPTYTDGYDHTGWQAIIPSFIAAFKAGATDVSALIPDSGKTAAGVMWYRPLMVAATCASDPMGKPSNWQVAKDAVNFAVLLPAGTSGVKINVSSGGNQIASFDGVAGLNAQSVPGMTTGAQSVTVVDGSGATILTAKSGMDVAADTTGICNFNYQVAKLA